MTVQDLKNNIENVDDSFKIFLSQDNNFLAIQYINKIAEIKGLNINFIDSIYDINDMSMSLIMEYSNILSVCITNEFNEFVDDSSNYANCIVVCNKLNKNICDSVSEYVIEFPKLLDWQIKDYAKIMCPGLMDEEIDWLYNATEGNIYRIENELSKINIFSKLDRRKILNELKNDSNTDLYFFDNFFLPNAIMGKNKLNIFNFLVLDKCKSISPLALIGTLLSECKKILFIKFNSGVSCDQLGISDGKRRFIQNNYSYLSEKKLQLIIEFLTSLDYKIKSGVIDINDITLSEYIICNMISIIQ